MWRQLNLFELIRELGYLIVRARVTSTATCLCYVHAQSAAPISGGGGLVAVVAISSQWSFDAVRFSTQTPAPVSPCHSVTVSDLGTVSATISLVLTLSDVITITVQTEPQPGAPHPRKALPNTFIAGRNGEKWVKMGENGQNGKSGSLPS